MHGHEDVLHFLLNDLCKNDHQCKSHICGRPLLKLRSEGQKQSCAYVASKYGRKKALEIMLNCQTDEEQKELLHGCLSDEVSCAHIAAKEGRADTLRFIIERERKLLTEKTKDGRTCAHFADRNQPECHGSRYGLRVQFEQRILTALQRTIRRDTLWAPRAAQDSE